VPLVKSSLKVDPTPEINGGATHQIHLRSPIMAQRRLRRLVAKHSLGRGHISTLGMKLRDRKRPQILQGE